eukprot:3813531-Rhodomonas_salina.3
MQAGMQAKSVGAQTTPSGRVMAKEACSSLTQRIGTNGEAPAPTVAECRSLMLLPPAVLGYAWPAERMVAGLRVCKELRNGLMKHCRGIVLVQKDGAKISHMLVTLRWKELKGGRKLDTDMQGSRTVLTSLDLGTLRENAVAERAKGVESLATVLGLCKALAHLDLRKNDLGDLGARRVAGVLGSCKALAHLDLSCNAIGSEAVRLLAGVLGSCKALAHLNLSDNNIGKAQGLGVGFLAAVLGEVKSLTHLNLSENRIGFEGAERLVGVLRLVDVLGACKELAHLDLSNDHLGDEGAFGLARVLGLCKELAHKSIEFRLNVRCTTRLPTFDKECPTWAGSQLQRKTDSTGSGRGSETFSFEGKQASRGP